jgi:hypothetical protein
MPVDIGQSEISSLKPILQVRVGLSPLKLAQGFSPKTLQTLAPRALQYQLKKHNKHIEREAPTSPFISLS